MSPLTMFLVRHGETLFNRRDVVQGWVDSPLTRHGVRQAERAAEQLRLRPLVAAYSSTSERCVDTAEIITAHHPRVPVHLRRGLKELHFGDLEAMPNEHLHAGLDIEQFFSDMLAGTGPGVRGGETGAAYRARIDTAFTEIRAAHPDGGEVLVVSHGVTIATFLATAGWETPGPVANASISIVHVEAGGSPRIAAVGLEDISAHV